MANVTPLSSPPEELAAQGRTAQPGIDARMRLEHLIFLSPSLGVQKRTVDGNPCTFLN